MSIWWFGNGLKKRRKTKIQITQNLEFIGPQRFPGRIFFGNKTQLEYPQGYSFSYLHSAYHIKQNCTSIAKIFLDAGELLCFLSVCAKILFRQIDASFSRDLLKHT